MMFDNHITLVMSVFILYFITLVTCFIYGSYRPEIQYIYIFFHSYLLVQWII